MSKRTTIHVDGPFGGCDEDAEHRAFEELVGGPTRAFRLLDHYREADYAVAGSAYIMPSRTGYKHPTQADVLRKRAKQDGYTDEEVDAFLHLQGQG